MKPVIDLIAELERTRFFGALTLTFRDGELTLIKKEQTILPNGRTATDGRSSQ